LTAPQQRQVRVDRLLEREAVLAELGSLLRAVRGGAGRVAILRGEAGVGKTAVISAFTARLDTSVQVLAGGCDPLAAPRPLGPLLDALSGLGPAAATALGAAIDAGDTGALYRRLLAMLRDGQRRVWVIEDAHWADGATLDLVRFLTRRIGPLPLLLVVSYRDEELDAQHPLSVALGDVASCAAVHRIALEPLSREAVATLASGSDVNAERLHHLTGGNPFFVSEVLAVGSDGIGRDTLPHSISEAVWGRLARLSTAARQTAQAAAVCGLRVEPALVHQLCPEADAGLAECLDAGVLVAQGDAVGFRHELARRATLDRVDNNQRKALHARALRALAEPPVDPNTLAALAFHADEAGDQEEAVRYGIAAAQRAAGLGAHRQAAELYALALRHAHTTPAEQRVVWFEQHAFASYAYGQAEPALSSWREAIALRHNLGDTLRESENLRWLSHLLWALGRVREAADTGLAAVRLVQDGDPCPQLAWSLVNMAEIGVFGFDPGASGYAARAIRVGAQLGDDAVVIRARGFAAFARVLRTGTGWHELEAAWRQAMATDARGETAGILGAAVCIFAALHYDLDRADRYIADAVAFCRDHDIYMFEALGAVAEALVGLHRGQWVQARSCAEDLLTRPGLPALQRLLPRLTLALIRARSGEQPVASLLDEIAAGSESDQLLFFPVSAARAEAAWLAGDDDTARSEAQRGLATMGPDRDPWLIWQLRRWAQLPGGTQASVAIDEEPITPFQLEVSGDWQAAAQAWTRRGCPYEAAIAQLGGDASAVESALATFRSLGARAAARRTQQRLSAMRGRTRRSLRSDIHNDPDGLSRREREVLTLIAAGLRDADIATKLSISPKTVGHHIEAILTKLGVDNRTQAAAQAKQSQTPGCANK
jgi:DNA-binding CsgD family transcriptional regulator